MSTVRQLFHLQEIDLEIARIGGEVSSIERLIGDRGTLPETEASLQAAQERYRRLQTDHADYDMKAGSIRSKLEEDRAKMYGGTVTNLKELEGLEKESTLLEADLVQREEALLQMMEELEESTAALAEAQERNTTETAQWHSDQESLTSRWQQLGEGLEQLGAKRKETAASLPPADVTRYESLRASKGGVAIARVERGLCRGCLMTLPTHQMQKARMAREPVTCNSCGRLLFVS